MALVEEVIIKSPRVSASPRVCVCVCGARTERNVRQLAGPTVQKIWFVINFFFFWATVTEGSGPAARQSSTLELDSISDSDSESAAGKLHKSAAASLFLALRSSVFALQSPVSSLGSWVWGSAAGLIDILVYRPPC